MKLSASLSATLLACSTAVSAIQSKPFYLVAISDDKKINGTAFSSCHEGAGIEGLCQGAQVSTKPKYSTFNFNYTKSAPNSGKLTWLLQDYSEYMSFFYYDSSNVALPLFGIGETPTYVSFDKDEKMFVKSYLDDTVTPPKTLTPPKALYRWYMCTTYFTSYTYTALAWVLGEADPQNPSCKKIDVVRQFH